MRENKLQKIGFLTSREYAWLKDQPELTQEEESKVKEYEKAQPGVDLATAKRNREKLQITSKLIWKNFLLFYKHTTGKEFNQTPDALKNVGPVIKYFAQELEFSKSENMIKKVGNSVLYPDLAKGLLIIGFCGNGKTTVMRTLSKMFDHYQMPMRFKSVNAHDIVTEYESISTPGDKDLFFERYKCAKLHIDDVKKEATASNYGKIEIIRAILEKRYDAKLQTYITCNFREGDQGNIADGLLEFGERYGEHIYDRIFEMFNILHFTGNSFRN
ncbi:MAG TPA: hypothetical protein VFM70_04395 [Salinimicrobium sp.]|nr:hypothetical protein [Salinimicrobium sp.]